MTSELHCEKCQYVSEQLAFVLVIIRWTFLGTEILSSHLRSRESSKSKRKLHKSVKDLRRST